MIRFHHLGIACADIENTLLDVRDTFGVTESTGIVNDPNQDADLCMVTTADGTMVELISGPVVRNIVKRGINPYHTCWEVDDIRAEVDNFVGRGSILVSPPKETVLFDGRPVAFLSSPLGLVELLQAAKADV